MIQEEILKMLDFSGQTVVVTGGGKGMGAGIARRFALAGASVAITYCTHADEASDVLAGLAALGCDAEAFALDQSDPGQCTAVMAAIAARFGRIDVLVNNAGVHSDGKPLFDVDAASWNRVLDTNLRGCFFCSQAAARHMAGAPEGAAPAGTTAGTTAGSVAASAPAGGAIISISSINGTTPLANAIHYGASKAGIEMMTRSLAVELGPRRIRVNAIAPGLIDSPLLDVYVPGWRERFIARAPLGRAGQPADIGNICLFLASPLASWITGQTLTADGGVTLAPAY